MTFSRTRSALGLAVMLLLASGGLTQAKPQASSEWPKTPDAATSGDFAVLQIATTAPKAFMAGWSPARPAAAGHVAHGVRLGQEATIFTAFKGCRANGAGLCRLRADFEVRGPHGNVFLRKTVRLWDHTPAPGRGVVSLGQETIGIKLTGDEYPSYYQVVQTVTDEVSKTVLHTQQTLQVID